MVQGPADRPTRARLERDELRWRRQQAIVDLALDLVTADGHEALTMQRIAEELECGIASVYRLFPSRDALIAELQHQALDVLHASWLLGASHLDDDLAAAGTDPAGAALARAVGAAWFWVVAEDGFGPQMDLSRRLFVDRSIVVPDEQAARIVPAALRLLDEGRRALDDAAEAGAITGGNSVERAVLLIASITGVVLTSKFSRWDQALFDSRHLAAQAIRDDFTAWGAATEALDTAFELVSAAGASGRLAPAVDRPTPRSAGEA